MKNTLHFLKLCLPLLLIVALLVGLTLTALSAKAASVDTRETSEKGLPSYVHGFDCSSRYAILSNTLTAPSESFSLSCSFLSGGSLFSSLSVVASPFSVSYGDLVVYSDGAWLSPIYRLFTVFSMSYSSSSPAAGWLLSNAYGCDTVMFDTTLDTNVAFSPRDYINLPTDSLFVELTGNVVSYGFDFSRIVASNSDVKYVKYNSDGSSTDWPVYSSSSGVVSDSQKAIFKISESSTPAVDQFCWLLANFKWNVQQIPLYFFPLTVRVDNKVAYQTVMISLEPTAPTVSMSIGSDGLLTFIAEGCSDVSYQVSGSGDFSGFGSYYVPGSEHSLLGEASESGVCYFLTSRFVDSVDREYTTTINIYNNSGDLLLGSFSFSGNPRPAVRVSMTSTGCTFVSGGISKTFVSSENLLAISQMPNSTVDDADFAGFPIFDLSGGDNRDYTFDLYLVTSDSTDSPVSAPTISISNDQLHIQYSGDDVTIWAIYVDGELAKTLNSTGASTWFDLSELSLDPGTYSITVAGGVSQTILTGTSAAVSYVVPSTDSIIKPGTWQAKKLVMTGEYSSLSAWPSSLDTVSFNFDTGDSSFSSMKYAAALAGGNYLHYGDTAVYYYGPLSDNVGWVADSYASISVSSAQQVPAEFYNWFIQNFEFVGEDPVLPEVKTVVNIYDSTGKVLLKTISFSGSTAPEVTLAVTSSGCTLTSGDNVQSWVASSGFYGLSLKAASSSASYSIGGSYVFPGGSSVDHVLSFYVVSERDHGGSGGSFGDGSDGNVSEVGTLFAGFGGFLSTVLSGFLSFQIVPGLSFGGMVEFFIYIGLLVVFIKLIS